MKANVLPPATAKVAVGCQGLTVRYPDRREPALRGVNLWVETGQRVLLLGPSGSGKSTLAYALSGMIPRIVEAELAGHVITPRRAGVLFQDPDAQFCMLTVEDEVAFSLENRGLPPAEMPPRIAAALAAVGLDVPLRLPVAQLSGGMKQRLALACVLALEPDVLFLDEPTAQLDPVGAHQVVDTLQGAAAGRTVLIVEHNLDPLVDWVHRVVLLGPGGTLLADDVPEVVFRHHSAEMAAYGIWKPRRWAPFWRPLLADAGGAAVGGEAGGVPRPGAPGAEGPAAGAAAPGEAGGEASPVPPRFRVKPPEERRPRAGGPPEPAPAPLPGTPLVVLEDVTARRGHRTVWSGLSLTLCAGEWVAVLGANGSGKTTFLHILAGLQCPAAGTVRYGEALGAAGGNRREPPPVGFVFQQPEHQFVTDSVLAEVALDARLHGWPEAEARALAHRQLARFGLEELAGAHPYTLSQGQKRLLSVASMLVVPRPLLVLDEPTFGQDARTAAELVRQLVLLHRQGVTVVMATHDLELAEAAATRLLVFGQGRLLYDGPPAPFFQRRERLVEAGLVPDGRVGHCHPPVADANPAGPAPPASSRRLGEEPAHGRGRPQGWDAGAAGCPGQGQGPPLARLNPLCKLAVHLAAMVALVPVANPVALAGTLWPPVVLGWLLGGMGWRTWVRGLAPFLLVALGRLWALAAFGAGQRVIGHFLWYRLTAEGLAHGLEVGLRILNFGVLGLLFARTTGVVELALSLMQQGRLSPRLAYGMLAALRCLPLMAAELERVRQAYQLRGLRGRGLRSGWLGMGRRYALALLVFAVRQAEAVAVALQARGFDGRRERTFYRQLRPGWADAGYGLALGLLMGMAGLAAVWLGRGVGAVL